MSSSKKTRPSDAALHPTRQMLDELDALMERMLSLPVEDREPALPPLETSIAVEEAPVWKEEPVPEASLPASEPLPEIREAVQHIVLPEPEPVPPPSPPSHLQGPHLRALPSGKIIVGRLSAPPLAPPSLPKEEPPEELAQATAPASEELVERLSEGESDFLSEISEKESDTVTEPSTPFQSASELMPLVQSHHETGGVTVSQQAAEELPDLPPPEAALPLIVKPAGLPRRRSARQWVFKLLLGLNQAYDRATAWLGGAGRRLRSARGRNVLGAAGLTLLALAVLWCLHDWLGWNWFRLSLE